MKYLSFSVWSISLSIIPSRFNHVVPEDKISLFLWLSNISSCKYTASSLSIHLCWTLKLLPCLATVNNAAVNIGVHVSFELVLVYSLSKYCFCFSFNRSALIVYGIKVCVGTLVFFLIFFSFLLEDNCFITLCWPLPPVADSCWGTHVFNLIVKKKLKVNCISDWNEERENNGCVTSVELYNLLAALTNC